MFGPPRLFYMLRYMYRNINKETRNKSATKMSPGKYRVLFIYLIEVSLYFCFSLSPHNICLLAAIVAFFRVKLSAIFINKEEGHYDMI